MRETHKPELKHNKWIWDEKNKQPNSWVIFTREFELGRTPVTARSYAAADTKYWLYCNGRLVVFEGSLFRESAPGCGYLDMFDLAPFLQKGWNHIDVLVWYHGNGGRNSVSSGQAGFFFECSSLGIYSDERFLCCADTSFYLPEPMAEPVLHGGYPVGYIGGGVWQAMQNGKRDTGLFKRPSTYPSAFWGDMYERPIPFHKTCPPVKVELRELRGKPEPGDLREAEILYKGKLPCAMALTPRIHVASKKAVTIRIRTDRFRVNGGPGGERSVYENHYFEFSGNGTDETFFFPWYIYGEELIVSCDGIPDELDIEVIESGFHTEIKGSFVCENTFLNALVQKAARTLYVCMRDNFFDCPDRERGQWIGDVSVQVPQVFYLLDENGISLVKKAVYDFILLRRGDILQGNVPGSHSSELPSQSLCAISEWGMLAWYFHFTQDTAALSCCFEPMAAYLKLWECDEGGLQLRKGDWQWYDHLYNQDGAVMEHAWYYSALRFLKKLADILNDHSYDGFIGSRMECIEKVFDGFWNGYAYTSGSVIDDRANALAVLSGLCPEENYGQVAKILVSVFNATVYMENFVLTALCEMGYIEFAYKRMMSRFYPLAINDNSTLWEDFFLLGTKNHAWSGAPATIAFRYLLGFYSEDGYKTFSITPAKGILSRIDAKICMFRRELHVQVQEGEITINGMRCEAGRQYSWKEL